MTAPVPPSSGVRRSRSDAVLGGVCSGVARSAGLDPLLLRIALVAVTVLTGGAGVLAYLAAWVLIPRAEAPAPGAAALPPGADRPGPPLGAAGSSRADVRAAWTTVGDDLRSLAGDLRRTPTGPAPVTGTAPPAASQTGTTAPEEGPDGAAGPTGTAEVPPGAVPSPRSPITAADDAATALGERLRAPEVQAGARKAAASVSQAVAASVDEVNRRVRRDRN